MRTVSYKVHREFELSKQFCLILWLSAFALQSMLFANLFAGMFDSTWVIGWVYRHAFEFYIVLALLHFLVCLYSPFRLWIRVVVCLGWMFSIAIHYLFLVSALAILYGSELGQH